MSFLVDDTVRLPNSSWQHRWKPTGTVELIEGNFVRVRIEYSGQIRREWFSLSALNDAATAELEWQATRKCERLHHSLWRPMTDDEQAVALALGRCSYTPASFHKRFARELAALAQSDEPKITEKQAAVLWGMRHRYRRQLPDSLPWGGTARPDCSPLPPSSVGTVPAARGSEVG